MTEMPAFNFKNINVFIISLFGVIFILSLMGLIKVKNPNAIMLMSFINVFLGVFGWIVQRAAYASEVSNNYPKFKRYADRELVIYGVIVVIVFLITLIGVGLQF